ncbi:MAG TPA: ParB/RepB/Spo0J family partition protein [Chloroflexia bacterium]|nr:ParB/RepB/Spo0J family partition protein [Chloroflexia bacterium]
MSAQNKSVPPPPSGGRNNRGVVHGIIGQLNESSQKRNPEAFLLPVSALRPNPAQPRRIQNSELDQELAEDIKVNGILEPILVRPAPDKTPNTYQIIAGERRYRAAKAVGLTEVPVVVKHIDDKQVRLVSLAENLQRAELEAVDEGYYFEILCNEYNYSTQDIANMIHKSKSYVQSRLNLLRETETTEDIGNIEVENGIPIINDGEISNNRAKKARLRDNSQSFLASNLKSVSNFTKYLTKVKEKLPELQETEKESLVEQLGAMQELIKDIERSIKASQG